MKITKLEIQKNNKEKINVHIDGKYSFSVTSNTALDYKLKENMDISEAVIEEIKEKDLPKLAVLHAINILSYASKTEQELKIKLKQKGYDEHAIEYAIEKIKKYGYIDDESYVESFIKNKAIPNGWGEQKILVALIKKGIDKDIIRDKLNNLYSDEEKIENIMEIAEKQLRKIKDTDKNKRKQKLYRYLLSKGYSYDLISSTINKLIND